MKLVIITAVREFEENIKKIFKKVDIKIYSFKEISGYRDTTEDAIESNWFGYEYNEIKSILFYSFAKESEADLLFEEINNFNKNLESKSKIHIAVLNIEKSN